jgi:heat shock protein HslJ
MPNRSRPGLVLATILGVFVLAAGACGGSAGSSETIGEPHPATLVGTAWTVVSVGGRTPVPGSEPTVAFDAQSATGSGGCNVFGGSYRYDPIAARIAFGDNLGMTAMACGEAARNEFETLFFQALTQATLVSIDGAGRLSLGGAGGVILLERVGRPATTG